MERTFLRIIFLVFPFIFFGLVNSSFNSDLGEDNKTWSTGEKKQVVKTQNLISKDTSSSNTLEYDLSDFKLRGLRGPPPNNNLEQTISRYKEYLKERKKELEEMKVKLDKFHSDLGNAFSKLVYVMRGHRDLNSVDYEFYLNKFYKLLKDKWNEIRTIGTNNSSIYSRISNHNERLLKSIIDARIIRNNARVQYDEAIKYLREVIDLINHNKGKCRSILDYSKFIFSHAPPVEDLSKVKLRNSNQMSILCVKTEGESSTESKIFSVRVILLCLVSVVLISGIAIYYILRKK